VLVAYGLRSALRQWIGSVGHRQRDDRPDAGRLPLPPRSPFVVTVPPQTTRLSVLIHSDAVNLIPSAGQHPLPRPPWPPSVRKVVDPMCNLIRRAVMVTLI